MIVTLYMIEDTTKFINYYAGLNIIYNYVI